MNAKSIAAVVGAAVLAGTVTYWVQSQKMERMRSDMEASMAQLEKLKAEGQAAQSALAAREQDLNQLRKSAKDLARARNELAQLKQQRNPNPNPETTTAKTAAGKVGPSAFPPGTYVSRDSLAFAGYATRKRRFNRSRGPRSKARMTLFRMPCCQNSRHRTQNLWRIYALPCNRRGQP